MPKRSTLSKSDQLIWDHVRTSVTPNAGMHELDITELDAWLDENIDTHVVNHLYEPVKKQSIPIEKITPIYGAAGMLRSKQRALTRGQLEPSSRIDLHGDRLEIARDRFVRFVKTAAQDQHKLVLVVTGKGGQERIGDFGREVSGVIKRSLPEWVNAPELSKLIAHYCVAHKRHGGQGAYYIFIRAKARR